MGMAASQARLLTITSRIHDVEYQAQSIQNAKIALATQSDQVYQDYLAALDQTTLTVKDNNNQTVVANFNTLCGINAARCSSKERYLLRDDKGKIIVSSEIAEGYKAAQGKANNAYEFAMFMMEGQPADFNAEAYKDKSNEIFNRDNNENKLNAEIAGLRDTLTDSLYELFHDLVEMDSTFDYLMSGDDANEQKSDIKSNLLSKKALLEEVYTKFDKNNAPENGYTDAVSETYNNVMKKMDGIKTMFETFQYKMYSAYNEEIFEGVGNNKNDFNGDDFWYYVSMYKQIESNGGRYVEITEFNGIDGVGDAATDSDWLKNAIQSGKITIDIASIDKKGQIGFQSTGVPSDSAIEYTTTTTIDKAKYAKVQAEYEHKTKQIDQKDKKFDMDLSKLETERNALTTEYDSVKKVVEDNVKRTFGIFS